MKMLKEKAKLIKDHGYQTGSPAAKEFRRDLNAFEKAFRKAVEESCAKVALSQVWRGTPSDNMKKNMAARDVAEAIRRRGKK